MTGFWPWMAGAIEGCGIRRHATARWRLEGDLRERCLICHPPADGLPAVHAESGNPLPASAFASHHVVSSHRA